MSGPHSLLHSKDTRAVQPSASKHVNADGFAILSVLLVVLLLSITAVPMMQIVAQNEKRSQELRILAYLEQEARENLEIGIYSLKLADGIPENYVPTSVHMSPQLTDLATKCTNRVNAIDLDLLVGMRLESTTAPIWHNVVAKSNERWGSIFMLHLNPAGGYERYIIVACNVAANSSIAVHGAEVATVNGGYHTLSFGRY